MPRENKGATCTVQLEEEHNDPLVIHDRPLFVLGAVLAIWLGYGTIGYLYQSRVLLNKIEQTWDLSQAEAISSEGQYLGEDTAVTLTRSGCYGTCPAYVVTIFGSGRVEFRGETYVCEKSPVATQIDSKLARRLVDGLQVVDFSKMSSYTHHDLIHGFMATVTLRQGGSEHKVEHYHGDANAPRLLSMIEERIDVVAGTSAWLGVREGWERLCVMPDGTRIPVEQVTPAKFY